MVSLQFHLNCISISKILGCMLWKRRGAGCICLILFVLPGDKSNFWGLDTCLCLHLSGRLQSNYIWDGARLNWGTHVNGVWKLGSWISHRQLVSFRIIQNTEQNLHSVIRLCVSFGHFGRAIWGCNAIISKGFYGYPQQSCSNLNLVRL